MIPAPTKKDPKHLQTLYHIIMNRQLTSVELSRLTNVGYSPRKIQMLKEKGVRFIHDLVDYKTREGRKTKIAQYTLLTPKVSAVRIYNNLLKASRICKQLVKG